LKAFALGDKVFPSIASASERICLDGASSGPKCLGLPSWVEACRLSLKAGCATIRNVKGRDLPQSPADGLVGSSAVKQPTNPAAKHPDFQPVA
jgi:hypothetical protein